MKTKQRKIKFLERKEVEKLVAGIEAKGKRNLRDRALIEVLFSTGMRISEALALQSDEMLILLKERAASELPIIGKGGWQRVVFFSPRAKEALRAWLAVSDEQAGGEVFSITPRAAQIMIKKRAKEAGIDKFVSPHVLRHSLATDLLRKGVDVRIVGEFLGHRNLNNTMIYTHVVNEQLKSIHKKLYR